MESRQSIDVAAPKDSRPIQIDAKQALVNSPVNEASPVVPKDMPLSNSHSTTFSGVNHQHVGCDCAVRDPKTGATYSVWSR